MIVKFIFEKRDLWIGIFWDYKPEWDEKRFLGKYLHIWICLIPCFPIHIILNKKSPKKPYL